MMRFIYLLVSIPIIVIIATFAYKNAGLARIDFFVAEFNIRSGKKVTVIPDKVWEKLLAYDWPGNIRELRNVIERAMLFCDEAEIDIAHLPPDIVE